MQYRSISDLDACVRTHIHRIPRDIDLVIGIPRSGLLAANLIALYLNCDLTDIDGLCAGRILSPGKRIAGPRRVADKKHILVVDDSIDSGQAMRLARSKVDIASLNCRVSYLAVYSSARQCGDVDIQLEHCRHPRVFQWNLMHHARMSRAALDIDGVLCVDPTDEQNDDGDRYLEFLRNAAPLHIPTVPVHALISSRLEKYRSETEQWLARHGVRYRELHLLDLPSKEDRIRLKAHGEHKARVLRTLDVDIFVESEHNQATYIARNSGKPVISLERQVLIDPNGIRYLEDRIRRTPSTARRRFMRVIGRLRNLRRTFVTPRAC
jgi:uncharacterized HAD superfamily protein/hypoxanthine phosphoribosyltransferase